MSWIASLPQKLRDLSRTMKDWMTTEKRENREFMKKLINLDICFLKCLKSHFNICFSSNRSIKHVSSLKGIKVGKYIYIATPKHYPYCCDKLFELYKSVIQSDVLNRQEVHWNCY